jgi:hypothetical protein
MEYIDQDPGVGVATQQINKSYQSGQIVQANATGFGAASDDFMERGIDLNEQLIHNKPATFFMRVSGNSMINAGIYDGDIVKVGGLIEVVKYIDGILCCYSENIYGKHKKVDVDTFEDIIYINKNYVQNINLLHFINLN